MMCSKRQLPLKPSVHTREADQPVLASCYGKRKTVNNGEYLRICGQEFWYFISGNQDLYTDIIEPLGHQAKQSNQRYEEELAAVMGESTGTSWFGSIAAI